MATTSDVRSENTILASILFCGSQSECKGLAISAMELNEMCFTSNTRREAFLAIKRCLVANGTPDSVNVGSMVSVDCLNDICLLAGHSTTSDISIFVEKLLDFEKARRIEQFGLSASGRLQSGKNIKETLQEMDRELLSLCSSSSGKINDEGFMSDFCGEWFKLKQHQMTTGETQYMATGIPFLDRSIGGIKPNDTIVIAGRSGMGKSSFASTIITNHLFNGGKPALFSAELGRAEIFDKVVSMISDIDQNGECVPFRTINNPSGAFGGVRLGAGQLNRIGEIVSKYIANSVFYVRGAGKTSVEEVMSKARKLIHEGKCDCLFLDHLGLFVRDKNKEREELTHITNSLRLFGSEVGVPVFEVVQLNRGADTAKEKPKLSHLKGSGSIEEDASVVIMPWRPYVIDKDNYKPEDAEIMVVKGRNGGEGTIPAYFCQRTTRFYELETHDRHPYDDGPQELF